MPVSTLVVDIDRALNGFIQQREAIIANNNLSSEGKKTALQAYFEQATPLMEQIVTRLWGAIETRPMGDFMLSEKGAAWVEMNVAERALAEAKEQAERAGVDPAWVLHNQTRVKSMLANIAHPEQFTAIYNQSSQQIKEALQDYGAVLLTGSGIEWERVRGALEAARAARMDTPAVQSAQRTIDQLIANLEVGIAVTRRVTDTFGQGSYYLGNVLNGVLHERRYIDVGLNQKGFSIEIRAKSWGMAVTMPAQFGTANGEQSNSGNWMQPTGDPAQRELLRRTIFG